MKSTEKEVINIMIEEAAEVIQSLTKVLRFGYNSTHPLTPHYSNRQHVETEIGDMLCMLSIMYKLDMINIDNIEKAAGHKLDKLFND